ncbi:MAG: sulfotransferase [Magnetococcales bacterium]|nr:sulfotransferase [Magnetococcales bacterium]
MKTLRDQQRNGELDLVKKKCQDLLVQNQPNSQKSSIQALLAVTLLQLGKIDEGRALLESAKNSSQTMGPSALADLGGGYVLLNEPETALQYLELARTKNPQLAIAHGRVGMALMKCGDFPAAKEALELARDLQPEWPAFSVNLARIQLLMGEPDAALGELDNSSSNSPLAIKSRVEALLALGRLGDAEQLATDMLQGAEADKPEGITLYTLVLAASNQHSAAEGYLRKSLEKFPDNLEILGQLSELSMVQGRFAEAIEYLSRSLKLEPENSSLWVRFSRAFGPHFSQEAAMEAAMKAVQLTEGKNGFPRAEALTAMAMALSAEDSYSEAEEFFSQALEESEDSPQARLGLGHMLLRLGRIDDAISNFEAVKEKNPVVGFGALITARTFPDDQAILEKIEKAARMPSIEGPVQSHLMFDLAASWEKLGEFDKAFNCAVEANQINQPFLPYDPSEHRKKIEDIMGLFSTEFFAQRRGFGNPSKLPVFVLGMPRSGTTLVEQIIASHPDVFGAGELGQIPSLIATLSAWERHIGSGQEYPQCLFELSEAESRTMAEQLLEDLQAYDQQALRVVDKLPHNFENIGLIHLLFPNATIIHLQREPKDVAISNFFTDYQAKYGGMGFAYDLKNIGEQLADHQRLMDHWHRVLPGYVLEVPYEGLVEQPEYHARRMLGKMELAWDADVLMFNKLDRSVKTASLWQVRQPIYKTSRQRWRNYAGFLASLELALEETLAVVEKPATSTYSLPPGMFIKGVGFFKDGRNQEAVDIFTRIRDSMPKHAGAMHYQGLAEFRLGNVERGMKLVESSLILNKYRPQWFDNMAKIYQSLNLVDRAATAKDIARKLHAQPKEPWRLLFPNEA